MRGRGYGTGAGRVKRVLLQEICDSARADGRNLLYPVRFQLCLGNGPLFFRSHNGWCGWTSLRLPARRQLEIEPEKLSRIAMMARPATSMAAVSETLRQTEDAAKQHDETADEQRDPDSQKPDVPDGSKRPLYAHGKTSAMVLSTSGRGRPGYKVSTLGRERQ